jgi:hypothetical protein
MKKLLLLICLSFSMTLYSQTVIKTTQSRIGKWDAIMENWKYSDWNYTEITFTANDTGVFADDVANSVYTFTSARKKSTGIARDGVQYTAYDWNAVDESGRNCRFSIIAYKGQSSKLSVMYNDVVFNYAF